MSIKSILFIFKGTEKELYALNTAFAVAKSYSAQLRILHITQEITPFIKGAISNPEIIAAMEEDNEKWFKKAEEYSQHYAAVHNVSLNADIIPMHHASAKFINLTGLAEDVVANEGRACDLIIVGQGMHDPNNVDDNTLISALFNTGRPLLLVPSASGILPMEWHNKVITFAWNGSLEASRALYNSIPFLERAESVHILYAREHEEEHWVSEEKTLMDYMDMHTPSSDVVIVDCEEHSAAEALLAKAVELKSDVLVMGAYGHTRFREMVLGGVTNYMLEYTHIPLLLSH